MCCCAYRPSYPERISCLFIEIILGLSLLGLLQLQFSFEFELPLGLQRSKLLVIENLAFQEKCSYFRVAVAVEASFLGGIKTLKWNNFLTAAAPFCNVGLCSVQHRCREQSYISAATNAEEKLFASVSHCSSEKGIL